MAIELPALPYDRTALEPTISAETIDYHYGKHHKAYVDNLNKMIEGTEFASLSLEEIIKKSQGGMFNNAAQIWNHTFYWNCLSPKGGGEPTGKLAELINKAFGDFAKFKDTVKQNGLTQFGSGWTWVVWNPTAGKLEAVKRPNQDSPLMDGLVPVLGIDVWEHAYYLKYQNRRPDYVTAWWNTVNWDAVSKRFGK